jgi:hypothetical protein
MTAPRSAWPKKQRRRPKAYSTSALRLRLSIGMSYFFTPLRTEENCIPKGYGGVGRFGLPVLFKLDRPNGLPQPIFPFL